MPKHKNYQKQVIKTATKLSKRNPKLFWIILIIILFLVGVGIGAFFIIKNNQKNNPTPTASEISISFLELGNKYTGDSTYIKAGDCDILIDAGSRQSSSTTIKNYVDSKCSDNKLEFVIATHAHQDHISGFVGTTANPGIFDSYNIGTLIDFPRTNATSSIYNKYCEKRDLALQEKRIEQHYNALDCYNNVGDAQRSYMLSEGISMDILYHKFYEEDTSDENDYSVCLIINQGNNHYLFTGDLEKDGESSLVDNNQLPHCQLFKGGHHGSYTANSDKLLSVITPETVCICCCAGSTEYTTNPSRTFPAQDAINRIAKYTDKIYVTTLVDNTTQGYQSYNGNILFYCDGKSPYSVSGSNNSTILKETEWFRNNQTWPSL